MPIPKKPKKQGSRTSLLGEDGDLLGEETEGGKGGKSGEIEFHYHDILSGAQRDDLLPPEELRRLQAVHKDIHKERVDKQKLTLEERAALKEGRVSPKAFMQKGLSQGGNSQFKKHPISNKAQFSGIDKQVHQIPGLNNADTNAEKKDALENRFENRLQNTPKFNPKPRMGG